MDAEFTDSSVLASLDPFIFQFLSENLSSQKKRSEVKVALSK